jgi:hypothetical protein
MGPYVRHAGLRLISSAPAPVWVACHAPALASGSPLGYESVGSPVS